MPGGGSKNIRTSNTTKLVSSFFLISMIFLSAMTLIGFHKQTDAQSSANCENLSLSKAEASGSEGRYPASNAIDNKFNTRWSNIGLPSWIEVDLGGSQNVCHVDISWYRGNLRVNTFTISTSNDGDNYEDVFTDDSSGTTKSFERYNVPPDTKARFLRITVIGNSEDNNYASISELDVYGSIPREICDNSIDDDGDGLIDIADSDCQQSGGGGGGSGTVDPFGIAKIYPTKTDGEEWYMDMNNPTADSRTVLPSMTKNNDGSWRITSTQVRYGVFTSSGYHPELITTYDQKALAAKEYMQSSNDWKNVEMTGYVKVNSFKGD
ncbi:MAG TPA: discoidin domain-containing protein, partial [Nitrososphaeraceae archaeon]|nr:discoidin domain-containing protein [Nitrososphaeraceae archaeon]